MLFQLFLVCLDQRLHFLLQLQFLPAGVFARLLESGLQICRLLPERYNLFLQGSALGIPLLLQSHERLIRSLLAGGELLRQFVVFLVLCLKPVVRFPQGLVIELQRVTPLLQCLFLRECGIELLLHLLKLAPDS